MAGSDSRDLTHAEQSFVAQVKFQLRHLPSQRQHQLLMNVHRDLLRNKPYDLYARLERDLGTPAQYAARMLDRGSASEPVSEPARRGGLFGRRRG